MKILMVNDYKKILGGTEKYVNELTINLINSGQTVNIFTSGESVINYKKSYWDLVKLVFNLQYFIKFYLYIKFYKPDIIHVHGILNVLSPSILLACGNIPIVMTIHNLQMLIPVYSFDEKNGKICQSKLCKGCINCVGIKGLIYEKIKRKIHKLLYKKIKLFICPSKYYKRIIEGEITSTPIIHLYNGFRLFPYSPISKNNRILYIGRLVKDKGTNILLQIAKYFKSKKTKYVLTVVGDGPEMINLRDKIDEFALEEYIQLKGNINNNYVEKYYINSTLVLVPSTMYENLPTVCIEANSVGRPVLGANIGGLSELIKNGYNGYLFNPENSYDVISKIEAILNNSKLINDLSVNSHAFSKNFDIKLHSEKMVKIYNTLI